MAEPMLAFTLDRRAAEAEQVQPQDSLQFIHFKAGAGQQQPMDAHGGGGDQRDDDIVRSSRVTFAGENECDSVVTSPFLERIRGKAKDVRDSLRSSGDLTNSVRPSTQSNNNREQRQLPARPMRAGTRPISARSSATDGRHSSSGPTRTYGSARPTSASSSTRRAGPARHHVHEAPAKENGWNNDTHAPRLFSFVPKVKPMVKAAQEKRFFPSEAQRRQQQRDREQSRFAKDLSNAAATVRRQLQMTKLNAVSPRRGAEQQSRSAVGRDSRGNMTFTRKVVGLDGSIEVSTSVASAADLRGRGGDSRPRAQERRPQQQRQQLPKRREHELGASDDSLDFVPARDAMQAWQQEAHATTSDNDKQGDFRGSPTRIAAGGAPASAPAPAAVMEATIRQAVESVVASTSAEIAAAVRRDVDTLARDIQATAQTSLAEQAKQLELLKTATEMFLQNRRREAHMHSTTDLHSNNRADVGGPGARGGNSSPPLSWSRRPVASTDAGGVQSLIGGHATPMQTRLIRASAAAIRSSGEALTEGLLDDLLMEVVLILQEEERQERQREEWSKQQRNRDGIVGLALCLNDEEDEIRDRWFSNTLQDVDTSHRANIGILLEQASIAHGNDVNTGPEGMNALGDSVAVNNDDDENNNPDDGDNGNDALPVPSLDDNNDAIVMQRNCSGVTDEAVHRILTSRNRFLRNMSDWGLGDGAGAAGAGGGDFDKFIVGDILADELVDDLLEAVASEVTDLCDDYVERVVSMEFSTQAPAAEPEAKPRMLM